MYLNCFYGVLDIAGVIARHPDILPYLRQALTTEAVESYFSHLFEKTNLPTHQKVQR